MPPLFFPCPSIYILFCNSVRLGKFTSIVRSVRVFQTNDVRLFVGLQPRDSVGFRNTYERIRILPASGLRELYALLLIFGLKHGTSLSCFGSLLNLRSMIQDYGTR